MKRVRSIRQRNAGWGGILSAVGSLQRIDWEINNRASQAHMCCPFSTPPSFVPHPTLSCIISQFRQWETQRGQEERGQLVYLPPTPAFWSHCFCLSSSATLSRGSSSIIPSSCPEGPDLLMASHWCWSLGLHHSSSVPSACTRLCDRFLTTIFSDPLGVYRLCPLHHVWNTSWTALPNNYHEVMSVWHLVINMPRSDVASVFICLGCYTETHSWGTWQ